MSLPNSPASPKGAPTNGGAPAYRPPRPDLYTLMLFVAWVALVVATVFLYLETRDYGSPPYQGAPQASATPLVPSGPFTA